MKYIFGKRIVVDLGGSIIYPANAPSGIDTRFLQKFKKFLEKYTRKGIKFVLVVGGGNICRVYQKAAMEIAPLDNEDKDWLGIHVTRLNAHFVRTIFRRTANPVVIDARGKIKSLDYPITVGGGWRPGWSTDYVSTALAHDFGCGEVIIAGKPSHVYDKNPDLFKDAKPFTEMTWPEYRKLIPRKWIPGFHSPVDPVAARFADENKIKAIIMDGRDLKNFDVLLGGKEFKGTIIANKN